MRPVIFQMMVSADGYYQRPNGDIDWHVVDAEFNDYAIELLKQTDTLVFGRVTYEFMASWWPTEMAKTDDPIVAGYMNRIQKVIFSNRLQKADWENTRLTTGDPSDEVARLKNEPGKTIAIFGSSDLALPLVRRGLIDEFRIMIAPVLLGQGKPLLAGLGQEIKLKLEKTQTLGSGVVILYYQPVRGEGESR